MVSGLQNLEFQVSGGSGALLLAAGSIKEEKRTLDSGSTSWSVLPFGESEVCP